MSNNVIYSANSGACQENPAKKFHYVYRITNLVDGKHYYGSRTTKIHPAEDLGKKYFSSSKDKEFVKDQKKNPENYRYKIIRVFENRTDALKLEIKLHNKFEVGVNESFYNRMKQTTTGFDTTGKVSVRDREGNFLTVSLTDERYLSGELVGATAGKVPVIDENGNTVVVDTDHEDYVSGKLKSLSSLTVSVVDKNGVVHRLKKDDPWIEAEGMKGLLEGQVVVRDEFGNTMRVDVDDPRFLDGTLVGASKDKIAIHNGSTIRRIHKDDPIPEGWERGSGVKSIEGKKAITDGVNYKYIESDEPVPEGWDYGGSVVGPVSGRIAINDGVRNKFIHPDDPVPEGWELGWLTADYKKGKIAITDGTSDKFIHPEGVIPEGWWRGQTRKKK